MVYRTWSQTNEREEKVGSLLSPCEKYRYRADFLSNQRLRALGQVTMKCEGRSYGLARGTVKTDNEYNQ